MTFMGEILPDSTKKQRACQARFESNLDTGFRRYDTLFKDDTYILICRLNMCHKHSRKVGARANASPIRSGPKGSSRNEFDRVVCPAFHLIYDDRMTKGCHPGPRRRGGKLQPGSGDIEVPAKPGTTFSWKGPP
jgi:hypothetical protein